MTQKHKECFESVFRTMEAFYNGDLDTLCVVIGCHYDISDENVKLAASIISSLPEGVISPVPNRAAALQAFSRRWLSGDLKRSGNKWTIEIEDSERRLLAHVTDVYSRLLMGQLNMIFEELDIGLPDNPHLLDFWHDARWSGAGGMLEARNLLFPDLKKFGWNGGYGISNPEVAFCSRLAYQMGKVLLSANEFCLPVTDEPPLTIRI
jgi:hypothetical protein